MVPQKIIYSLVILSLILASPVLAITGAIGNARMILRIELGEEIQRSIKVINQNNVTVDIELSLSGDLENHTQIIDETFRLEPNQEKDAKFIMNSIEIGTTETRIHIKFQDINGTESVGLASTIIVITSEPDPNKEINDNDQTQENEEIIENQENSSTQEISFFNNQSDSKQGLPNLLILFAVLLLVVFILLITLLFIVLKKTKKNTKK